LCFADFLFKIEPFIVWPVINFKVSVQAFL